MECFSILGPYPGLPKESLGLCIEIFVQIIVKEPLPLKHISYFVYISSLDYGYLESHNILYFWKIYGISI